MTRTGLILAGGKSSRMRQDKALMMFNGKPMARHASDALKSFCNEILVASNQSAHSVFGDKLIFDRFPNSGPLAGLHSGLLEAKNKETLVLSCDVPFISSDILSELVAQNNQSDAVVARCDGRVHPLVALYRESALDVIESSLNAGNLKMLDCLKKLSVTYVDFPASFARDFNNINSPEDFQVWKETQK